MVMVLFEEREKVREVRLGRGLLLVVYLVGKFLKIISMCPSPSYSELFNATPAAAIFLSVLKLDENGVLNVPRSCTLSTRDPHAEGERRKGHGEEQ